MPIYSWWSLYQFLAWELIIYDVGLCVSFAELVLED